MSFRYFFSLLFQTYLNCSRRILRFFFALLPPLSLFSSGCVFLLTSARFVIYTQLQLYSGKLIKILKARDLVHCCIFLLNSVLNAQITNCLALVEWWCIIQEGGKYKVNWMHSIVVFFLVCATTCYMLYGHLSWLVTTCKPFSFRV